MMTDEKIDLLEKLSLGGVVEDLIASYRALEQRAIVAEQLALELANEVSACLGIAESEIRMAVGNTNVDCLMRKLDAVQALLAQRDVREAQER
jgi:hypothetical protein